MVEASPKQTSPSIIPSSNGQLFSISSRLVHTDSPDWLALVMNIGIPKARISFFNGMEVAIRIARVSMPPLTSSGTSSFFFRISVTGPGMNASIRRWSLDVIWQMEAI